MVFREQRQALNFKRPHFHLNPVQELIKRKQRQLHPHYKNLAKIGLG